MRPLVLASLALLGCGPRVGPSVDPIGAATVAVGGDLQVPVHGSSPDGAVSFDFAAPDLPDLKTRAHPATLTNYAEGEAVFRFQPRADDVGSHEIDLAATGNGVTSTVPFVVTVTPGTGAPPVFREPTGDGTTLELSRGPCADVDVLVEDADQVEVMLSLAPPLADNATLDPRGPNAAILRFCPSDAQVQASLVYPLTLAASDGAHEVLKPYTIVVRPAPMVTCTGAPPTIVTHPLGDVTTTSSLHVQAKLLDDVGVVGGRVLWTNVAPDDPQNPDFGTFFAVEMKRASGDAKDGGWDGWLPNPVVASPPGTVEQVWYAVVALDDDPPWGCAQQTISPPQGAYTFLVTRP